MFEAYKVAVRLTLINQVSTGLLALSSQFSRAHQDATKLQTKLDAIKRSMLLGGAAAATGAFGLNLIAKAMKPAEEYHSQLNRLNMAGWTQRDIALAVGDAWRNTGTVITTTATQNLATLLDLKNVFGTLDEARRALPIVSRIQTVLAASADGKVSGQAKDIGYSVSKALDVIGKGTDPATFARHAEQMAKVIIATQGRVTPEAYKSVFQYARQAKFGLNEEFMYQILPSLIQENASATGGGGGSRGVGPMLAAFYRFTNQGFINKKAMPELEKLRMIQPGTALKTHTSGTTIGPLLGHELAAENPFRWVHEILLPAIKRVYGDLSKKDLRQKINELYRGNQLAASLAVEFAEKPENFLRDAENIRKTMSTADAYKAAISRDPKVAREALGQQWDNFNTALTMSVVPVLIPALMKLTAGLNSFADWARRNPDVVKPIALAFATLAGVVAVGGTLALATAGFKALGLALTLGKAGTVAGALSATAVGLKAVGAAAGAFMALYAGWKLGDYAGSKIDQRVQKNTGGAHGSLRSWLDQTAFGQATGWFKYGQDEALNFQQAKPFSNEGGGSRFVAGKVGQPLQVNTQVNLDGRKVGEAVSQHQARELARQPTGPRVFDGNISTRPVSAGATGGW